jgi:Raf kinase inhibitor-like YbhB/YbcL family protein
MRHGRQFRTLGIALLACAVIGCRDGQKPDERATMPAQENGGSTAMTDATIAITSAAFKHDVSPPLTWTGLPDGTKELVLIVDDPDAPTPQPWVHWVIYGLPGDLDRLPEGVAKDAQLAEPAGARQGKNSWNQIGYRGPAPPKGHGVHHYHFKLYALDAKLGIGKGLDKGGLLKAMDGHVIGRGELVGTYER